MKQECAIKKSLEEFLGEKGVGSPIGDYTLDKTRFPHGLTMRQHNRVCQDVMKKSEAYSQKRAEAVAEYNRLVVGGVITPKSRIEKMIDAAKGHPDNQSVQAARRVLLKRGYTESVWM